MDLPHYIPPLMKHWNLGYETDPVQAYRRQDESRARLLIIGSVKTETRNRKPTHRIFA